MEAQKKENELYPEKKERKKKINFGCDIVDPQKLYNHRRINVNA
jgi:hypothetical protein